MQDTWVQPLGQEGFLEKGMSTHSIFLAWRISRRATVHGVAKIWTQLRDFFVCLFCFICALVND